MAKIVNESNEPVSGQPSKKPRHVALATKHLVAQRAKAAAIRDSAAAEIEELDAALTALGWREYE